ncbi:MAG: sigma-70 family RNA polymerase sigma factor [Candidatus Omnitrophica bacterium]|nr:sigma-70 family RNA polymerase sigma factor [Candidatus Omnitrophota bacterium]
MDISRDLIKKAVHGDIEAFEAIYRATSRFVFHIALRMTNNRANAEDITQEVFIKVHKNLWKFRFESQISTWMYRITVNTVMNYMRKSPKSTVPLASLEGYLPDARHEEFERNEQRRLIGRLLNELNPDQRAVLVLREFEGLDYREIARVLKIKINTVRTRLKRAREKLMERGREAVRNEL